MLPLNAAGSITQWTGTCGGSEQWSLALSPDPQEPETLATGEDTSYPPISYFHLISNFLRPEKPTKAVVGLIEKTVEVMKLDHQIKETQIQQKLVMKEMELLLNEKLPVQAETKVMLVNLTMKAEEYIRDIEDECNSDAQESGEVPQTRRESESATQYAKKTSELKTPLLSENGRLDLEQQLEAGRDISLVKEKQLRELQELQALQEVLKKARAETAAKAQARYLQEISLLEKQLGEPGMSKRKERQLRRRVQALQEAAEMRASQLHQLYTQEESGVPPGVGADGPGPAGQPGKDSPEPETN
ncbi:coiled-coil domain-containing protein 121 [Phyllostomus discolor]|nr:coiled-coil domain-containing protein 121 [Phyllostomus discolor]